MNKFTTMLMASIAGVAAATDSNLEALVADLVKRVDNQWQVIEAQAENIATLEGTIATLEGTIESHEEAIVENMEMIAELQTDLLKQQEDIASSRQLFTYTTLNLKDDDDCLPFYNSTLKQCIFKEDFKFTENVVFKEHVDFEGTTFFDANVKIDDHATLDVRGKADFKKDVSFKDSVRFDDPVTFYDDVTIDGPTGYNTHPIDFIIKDRVDVKFEQDLDFVIDTDTVLKEDNKLDVLGMAAFKEEVKFEHSVRFDDPVTFYGDVTIDGPDRNHPIDFIIKDRVDVKFEQDRTFVVDTDTIFKEDVIIAEDEDDVRRRALQVEEGNYHRKLSGQPTLKVAGKTFLDDLDASDVTVHNLVVEDKTDLNDVDIHSADINHLLVKGGARFGREDDTVHVTLFGTLDVKGDAEFSDIVVHDLTANGHTTLDTATVTNLAAFNLGVTDTAQFGPDLNGQPITVNVIGDLDVTGEISSSNPAPPAPLPPVGRFFCFFGFCI